MSAHDLSVVDVPGVGRVALLLPVVPEDAHEDVREGIARRRLVAVTGQCPCGGRRVLPNRAERRRIARSKGTAPISRMAVEHEDGCPATDAALARHGWVAGGQL